MAKKDGGAGNVAKQQRADEAARQGRVREGTSRINSIFDGAASGTDQLGAGAAYDPTKTYYNADGTKWAPSTSVSMPGSVGFEGGSAEVPLGSLFASGVNDGSIYGGVKHTGGFDDAFYSGQRQKYIDYATPQLDDQYTKAQKDLTYALARGGLLDSSSRATKEAELKKTYDLNKQQISDKALSYETDTRNNVENARADLIQMLNSTGDAEGAATQAASRATSLSAPPAYSALSNLFADFTNTLGTQAALERANALSGGQTGVRYNTGLFAPNSNAVTVR